jgi:glycosyltransferase involved in cell wall biosynthesis
MQNSNKSVLHLNSTSSGGAFIAGQRLVEALNRSGKYEAKHLIFSSNLKASSDLILISNTFFKRIRAFIFHAFEKLLFLKDEKDKDHRFLFSSAKFGIDVTKHPLFIQADIIHLHWVNKGFLSLKSIEKVLNSGKKIVWTLHDMWVMTGGCHHSRDCFGYIEDCNGCPQLKKGSKLSFNILKKKKTMFAIDSLNLHFTVPSNWMLERVQKSIMLKSFTTYKIPNLINTKIFNNNHVSNRKALNISRDEFVIGFASANVNNKRKGIDFLIESLSLINYSILNDSNIRLLIMGSKKDELIFPKNVQVIYTGSLNNEIQLAEFYNICDVFVSPTLEESFGLTVLESIACGTPVVAFNVGGIPDIIEHKTHGYLSKYLDSSDLAKGIEWASTQKNNPYFVNECQKRAEEFSEQKIVKEFETLYSNL